MNSTDPLAKLASQSLGFFAQVFFPEMRLSAHHHKMIKCVRRVLNGDWDRLLISMPPRHTKSLLCAEMLPPFALGWDPTWQVMYATYGSDLSTGFGKKVKQIMTSEEYKMIFPDTVTNEDSQSASYITTSRRGSYVSTSIGGSVTGKGADLLIIDDPFKDRMEADSQRIRDNVWDWYASTARTRLQPGGKMIVIQTRWHEDDLVGRLQAQGAEDWKVLNLPAISEDNKALWPDWMPLEELLKVKQTIGDYEFNALYQGNPLAKEGGQLKPERITYLDHLPDEFDRLIIAFDTAIKTGQENDYSVGAVMGSIGAKVYLIDLWRDKVEYPMLKKVIDAMYERFKPSVIHVEDKASGQQIIQEMSGHLPIEALKAIGDKVQRAQPLADTLSTGLFHCLKGRDFQKDMDSELRGFPAAKHDDIVDALAYGTAALRLVSITAFFSKPLLVMYVEPQRIYRALAIGLDRTVVIWYSAASGETYKKGAIQIIRQISGKMQMNEVARRVRKEERDCEMDVEEGVYWHERGISLMEAAPALYDLFLEPIHDSKESILRLQEKIAKTELVIHSSMMFETHRDLMGCVKDKRNPGQLEKNSASITAFCLAEVAASIAYEEEVEEEAVIGDTFEDISARFGK